MRLNLRVALFLLIGLVAIGGAWSGIAASQTGARSEDNKTAGKSVTLVIDFGADSGRKVDVITVSNLDIKATGWDVLVHAGLKVQGTDQYPTGFVCRIEGWPSEQNESCDSTPAYSKGHWAYFLSSKKMGGNWILSGQGAATHVPECGDVEGWQWVTPNTASNQPSVKPEADECLVQ